MSSYPDPVWRLLLLYCFCEESVDICHLLSSAETRWPPRDLLTDLPAAHGDMPTIEDLRLPAPAVGHEIR